MEYNFSKIEKKWQKKWEASKAFQVKEDAKKKKYYVLEMYPYPSASFLHMGHVRNFTIGDVFARFKRMHGFNVLYPMGFDSFGLPAETAAKKDGIHPREYTEHAISKIMEYFKALGNSYDWSRTLSSHEPDYYKWNQLFFVKMFERGLAYRKKAPVNWCGHCQSVLANEEAEGGRCWRCGNEVTIKETEQWFLKITEYADELLKDLDKIEWPEKIKIMQRNWIGKSKGTEIVFEIETLSNKISNVVIVHGSPSKSEKSMNEKTRTYDKHWMPWLKSKLEERGIKTEIPLMSEPWEPKYNEWKKILKRLDIDENSVLIGHSSGGGFLVRWLGETNKKIKKLILVAPAIIHSGQYKSLEDLLKFKINEKIKDNIKEIVIFVSNEDSKGIKESVKIFSDSLNVKPIELIGKGHFTMGDMGTEEFPELINEIFSSENWPVFTTRPDTLFGVTFLVISAQHPRLMEFVSDEQRKEVEKFVRKLKSTRQEDIDLMEKEGVFTGSYAVHPLTREEIPIWAGNFVVADYGSGIVMGVPAHDQRDFDFAKRYKIPVKVVISKDGKKMEARSLREAYTGEGKLINSGNFDGEDNEKAKKSITDELKKKKLGSEVTQYRIRDWMISRQRYWGTPIPVVYCEKCGVVAVPERDLPVLLPEKVDFRTAGNPLATSKDFVNTKCPKCGSKGKRETDTMGGFVDSSWYFLRFCDSKNKKKPFDREKAEYWMPVDQYIGGAEHAVMHLIYARFFVKVLRDLGFTKLDEPFTRLFNQGIVYKDGAKMSKSKGNVVFQTDISNKYGIDTARLFLMSVSSPDKQMEWNDEGVEGSFRIINRVIRLKDSIKSKGSAKEESKINFTIKKVTEAISGFEYPKAIVSLIEFLDYAANEGISRKSFESLLKLISPFCPHIAEELWEQIGNKGFISLESWPRADERKIDESFEMQDKQVEKLVEDINYVARLIKEKEDKKVEKAFVYVIPKEKDVYASSLEIIKKKTGLSVEIYAVNDSKRHDPENKANKAKPGKPAIYLE
jgi:leucyl-tRNA synthetase